MTSRTRTTALASTAGLLAILLAVASLARHPDRRAVNAGAVDAVLREVVAHGPGIVTLVPEGRHLTLHLLRHPSPALVRAGLEDAGVLRFRLPPGLRLIRVDGPDTTGLPLCRSFRCRPGDPGWIRWVMTSGQSGPEIWVTLAGTGESDVRIHSGDGTFSGLLILPTTASHGH